MPALKFTKPSCITVVPGGEVGAEPDPVGVGDADPARHHVVGHPGELVHAVHGQAPARRRARCTRSSSTRSGGHGPAEVQATLVSSPKTPSRLASCGLMRRWESRCRRSQTSKVSFGGVGQRADRRPARRPSAARAAAGARPCRAAARAVPRSRRRQRRARRQVLEAGRPRPSLPVGNQTSSTCPSSVSVARPRPQAGCVSVMAHDGYRGSGSGRMAAGEARSTAGSRSSPTSSPTRSR